MMATLVFVALGGAIGAAMRFLMGMGVVRLFGQGEFPIPILTVNVLGSFLMGVFVVAAAQRGLTDYAPFVMTGVLGGFTTFSAFSLETMTLIERGHFTSASVYVLLSVVLSVGGLALGLWLARSVWA